MASSDAHGAGEEVESLTEAPLALASSPAHEGDTGSILDVTAPTPLARVSSIVVLASIASGFSFGYDICITSSALGALSNELALDDAWKQAFVALVMVGATVGAACSGPAAEARGRKPVMLLLSAIFIISALLLGLAPDRGVIVLGRLLVGVAIGGSSVVATVYLAEVTPAPQRGLIVTLYEVALCVGCLCAFAVGAAIPTSWRWMLGLGALPAAMQFVALFFLPESAHWRATQASKARSSSCVAVAADALSLIRTHPRATLLAIGVAVCQNAAFSNAILYYVDPILASMDVATPRLFALLIAVMKLMGVAGSTLCVRSCSRRRMLMLGSLAESAAFAAVAIGATLPSGTPRTVTIVGGLCAFVLSWNASWAPLMFVVCAEVVPLKSRAAGMATAIATYWLTCIATNGVLLTLLHAASPAGLFGMLTLLTLLPIAFVAFFLPETSNATLREIADVLEAASNQRTGADGDGEAVQLVAAASVAETRGMNPHHV